MRKLHRCKCAVCQSEESHPDKDRHEQINLLMTRLDERQRRWYAATEAKILGWGGITRMSQITGLARDTIQRGMRELREQPDLPPDGLLRAPGGGRPRIEKSQPGIKEALEAILESEVAGDPEGKRQWVRASLDELQQRLDQAGFRAARETIRRMLIDMGYSLRLNAKTKTGQSHPQRDEQFRYIEQQKQAFLAEGQPVISVDTKKRN